MMCVTPGMYDPKHSSIDAKRFRERDRNANYVFCANCGGLGHVYKTCNHPVISYGVICYKTFYDPEKNCIYPKYLMVQRRDSLSYVEFLRGKYKPNNREYLMKLFTNMTPEERERIGQSTFEELWTIMWTQCGRKQQDVEATIEDIAKNHSRNFNKEWKEAAEKYETIKKGFNIMCNDGRVIYFDIDWLLQNTKAAYTETEWGFPKGRRNINEDDLICAVREFKEETGIHASRIRINKDLKPIEEVFTGSNNVRYKHVYYVARYVPSTHPKSMMLERPLFDPGNTQQTKEVRDVQWFTYKEAQDKIRVSNMERKELFKRLNHGLIKSFCNP